MRKNCAKGVKTYYLFCFSHVQRSLGTLPGKITIVVRTPYAIDAVITHMITCGKSIFCHIPSGEGNLSPMVQIIQSCHWCKISYLPAKVHIYTSFSHGRTYYTIIKLLAEGNGLFMVGDEDQSIYGFRGAYPRALLNFRYDYKNPYILRMGKNIDFPFSQKIFEISFLDFLCGYQWIQKCRLYSFHAEFLLLVA